MGCAPAAAGSDVRPDNSEAPVLAMATADPMIETKTSPAGTGAEESSNAVAVLAALAQDSRLAIFRLLVERGPEGLAVGEIAERLGLPGPTLSFHLKELAHTRLISGRQSGRFIYYSANYRTINGLIDFLTRNCCKGATCDIACAPSTQRKRRAG